MGFDDLDRELLASGEKKLPKNPQTVEDFVIAQIPKDVDVAKEVLKKIDDQKN